MNRVCKLESRLEFIVMGEACFQPVFNSELAAQMFARFFDCCSFVAPEYSNQPILAMEIENFINSAFGKDPEVFDADIPAWLLVKLAEDFIQEDHSMPFATYHDLVDFSAGHPRLISSLLEAFEQWKQTGYRLPACA